MAAVEKPTVVTFSDFCRLIGGTCRLSCDPPEQQHPDIVCSGKPCCINFCKSFVCKASASDEA